MRAGVDVGGTKCLGVLLADDGAVVAEERRPTPRGAAAIVDAVCDVIGALGGRGPVDRVGVGVPGLVDRSGTLRVAPNLAGVMNLDVKGQVEARCGLVVSVDNDATCAAWGERMAGAARGRDDVVLVTLGTGIGGGFVLGGRLYRGANGFAGEIGHVVVDPDGPPCVCGQRGCWERYGSGSGLARLAREAAVAGQAPGLVERAGGDPDRVRGEDVTVAAAAGDPGAVVVLDRFAWWLALGLANLANTFDPACFVIGGGLIEAGDLILDPVRRHFVELVEAGEHRPPVEILPAQLGDQAGAVGAALLDLDEAR